MIVDEADLPRDGQNSVAETDQTGGIWAGVLCLLLAIPVTAWGYWSEPNRLAFWLFVPPLVASVLAVLPLWLLWRSDPSVGGRGLIVYAVLFPILGVPVYLLFFLPVLGAWFLTQMSLGLDRNLFLDYAGIWWVMLLLPSAVLLWSDRAAQQIASFVFPGAESFLINPIASYLSVTMPWIGVLVHLGRLFRSRQRFKVFFIVFFVVTFFVVPAVWCALFGDVETVATFVFFLLIFLTLSGLIARFLEPLAYPEGVPFKPLLVGWVILALNAALGGALEGLRFEMLFTPILFILGSMTVLPLLFAFRVVFDSSSRKFVRLLWLLALLELPVAYAPFYVEARVWDTIHSTSDHAEERLRSGRPEEAVALLTDAFEKAWTRDGFQEAAEFAVRLARLHLDLQRPEEAHQVARKALVGLADVPFGWYVPPCIGDTCSGEDPIPRERELVLELLKDDALALMALGNEVEASRVGLDAWRKAVQAEMWPQLATLALTIARSHQTRDRYLDAYWWLADARNRILRGGGPPSEAERLQRGIESLRASIGDDAFWSIVQACARKDPEWCTSP